MTPAMSRKHSNELPVVSDGYTRVMPVSARKISLDRPILIAGFPDSGMVGSVCINHIIEQLKMHQIASVESQHVMPAAIFIGKRFRHPFRIYANDSGTVCTLICEVPVMARGTSSIINTIIDWSTNAGIREIVVLGGIMPTNFSPPYVVERKPLILQNEMAESKHAGRESTGMLVPDDAVIVGLSGSLLSMCAARGLKCTALMIPTLSEAPDPEGAAIVLEALVKITPNLKIDTTLLRQKAETIKKHLEEFLKLHQQQMQEYERASSRETERIYK
ncbi:MAG TPA: PAC2 family protein [Nitrososphaera sp.]|nr:PAC2 family protein [Nitrososphaera sp.]